MLLERDDELMLVSEALRSAHHGSGSLLVIGGPLGNGKSELLRALPGLADQDSTRILSAGASVLEQDYAFGVVRQLLEPALFGAAEKMRERWLSGAAGLAESVFADAPPVDAACTQPFEVRQAVLLGLQALVERMSAEQTLMILADDLQWSDEPSLQWLAHLANRPELYAFPPTDYGPGLWPSAQLPEYALLDLRNDDTLEELNRPGGVLRSGAGYLELRRTADALLLRRAS